MNCPFVSLQCLTNLHTGKMSLRTNDQVTQFILTRTEKRKSATEDIFSTNLQKTPRIEIQTTPPASEPTKHRKYSNNMADCCTHKCHICGKLIALTTMRAHTKRDHNLAIKLYIEKYGNFRTQLAKVVYHKCGVCKEEMLLDGDELHKHCNRHKIKMKEYTAKFLRTASQTGWAKIKVKIPEDLKSQPEVLKSKPEVWIILDILDNLLRCY